MRTEAVAFEHGPLTAVALSTRLGITPTAVRRHLDALVDEVSAQPGALPLLSTALVELWQHQRLGWLRLESYTQSGGVRGAVARQGAAQNFHQQT